MLGKDSCLAVRQHFFSVAAVWQQCGRRLRQLQLQTRLHQLLWSRRCNYQHGTHFSMQSTYPTYPAISGPVYIVFDSLAVLCIQQNALPFGRGQPGAGPESVCGGRSLLMAARSHPWQEPPSRRHGKHSTSTACRLAGCRSARQRLGLEPWKTRGGCCKYGSSGTAGRPDHVCCQDGVSMPAAQHGEASQKP